MFLIFGVATTLVNLVTYFFFTHMKIPYAFSNAIAIIVAIFFAYFTNRKWVFESQVTDTKGMVRECISFFTSRVITAIIDMFMMVILISVLNINDIFAKIVTLTVVIILNYVLSKFVIFKKQKNK